MIKRDGKVAIRYFQTVPHHLRVGAKVYDFRVNQNICMCWVDEEDVPAVLATPRKCCGGQRKAGVYRLTDALHVSRWTGEEYRDRSIYT